MAISERNRRLFEGVGFEVIRRELTIGGVQYIPIDDATRAEAQEWVTAREKERRDAELARIARERQSLKYMLWTLVAAVAAVIVGIIGIVVTIRH